MSILQGAISNRGLLLGQALKRIKRMEGENVGFLSAKDIWAFIKGRLKIAGHKVPPSAAFHCNYIFNPAGFAGGIKKKN